MSHFVHYVLPSEVLPLCESSLLVYQKLSFIFVLCPYSGVSFIGGSTVHFTLAPQMQIFPPAIHTYTPLGELIFRLYIHCCLAILLLRYYLNTCRVLAKAIKGGGPPILLMLTAPIQLLSAPFQLPPAPLARART